VYLKGACLHAVLLGSCVTKGKHCMHISLTHVHSIFSIDVDVIESERGRTTHTQTAMEQEFYRQNTETER